jgi:hypothetical protein
MRVRVSIVAEPYFTLHIRLFRSHPEPAEGRCQYHHPFFRSSHSGLPSTGICLLRPPTQGPNLSRDT